MAGLKTYHAKRDFSLTAEPRGKISRRGGHAYVIQKHAARRLHYDLRLELDGVMKSWAVTRGPSLVPGEKRLAVQTEDHPIDYNTFEGTIPLGEYGGGTVMIWDRGSWQPEDNPHKGFEKGHLKFRLDGQKLHGGWHLVRLRKRPGDKKDNWLLIKQHDDAERSASDADILEEMPLSAASGRTMDEIAANPKRKVWHSNRGSADPAETPTKKPAARTATGPKVRAAVQRPIRKRADREERLLAAPKARLPAFVEPCLATLTDSPPDTSDWIHEIKFDGYRLQARIDRGKVKLITRHGLDWTKKFGAVADALGKLPVEGALIDGEVVVEDKRGVSRFSALQQALKTGDNGRMRFYAFDLLHLDGADLKPLPLTARKAALERVLAKAPARGPIRFSQSIEKPEPDLLARACEFGVEGIVSKRAGAPYHSGRGTDWLKTKCSDRQEFVIVGFVPATADTRAVGALVLGTYDKGKLRYAGRTGTGFTHKLARDVYRRLQAITVDKSPLQPVPKDERGSRAPVWVEPKLVAEVDFRGWTHGDRVRQASFQGLREDKQPEEVIHEEKKAVPASVKPAARRNAADNTIGTITLTHPERVYWEDVGVTKRDLAEYYVSIWDWISPHLVGRPIALVRCPEGADVGGCFFQKHAHGGLTAEHLHLVSEKGDQIISVDRVDGLIALVQAGVLEIHTRGSTIDHLDKADRLVFDFDPGPGTGWGDIVAAARDIRDRLKQVGLETFLKTTGGKGLHVVLPIEPTAWEEAKLFTQTVARAMEADDPTRYIATSTKAKRANRIFIDYLRNSREATAIAPYSTRARPGAPVAVPIDWSELRTLKSANQYNVQNLMARLKRKKDPWAEIGKLKQRLPKMK